MTNIKIKELCTDGMLSYFSNQEIIGFNWIDSFIEESTQFDEEKQCMIEKTRHQYIIFGVEEFFELSFYSEVFLTKKELISKLNVACMNGLAYVYDEVKEDYFQPDY